MSARRAVFFVLILAIACVCAFGQASGPTIPAQNIASPYVNTPYSQVITATGGAPPYTWSFASGNVPLPPSWLAISASGSNSAVLSGTAPPSAANQTFNFVVVATGTNSLSGSRQFGFIVRPQLIITPTSVPNATLGTPFSVTFTATGGVPFDTSSGQPGYAWSMAPANGVDGLTLGAPGANSITLSGTPATLANKVPFIIQVTDGLGTTTVNNYTLNASPPLAITTATSLPAGTVGTSYSQALAASGGIGPYTWSGGQGLPAGLTLSPSGSISGTPTAAGPPVNFSVSVADSIGNTAGRSFALTIAGSGITVQTTSLPAASVGSPYNATLTAVGGASPYTWSLISGSLPAGLTLNGNGTISGTPAANATTSSFTVRATDTANVSATSGNLSIAVNTGSALTITTPSLPNGIVNTVYAASSLLAAGGTAPYTWSLASGTFPPGISFDSGTGAVFGTPTTVGTFSFTVQVKDSSAPQASATKNFSVTVIAAGTLPVTITPTGTQGPAQQPTVGVSLGIPSPTIISGTLTLTFASAVGGDDQMVRFSNGTRTATFSISQGATDAFFLPLVSVITGTVAGTITITASLKASGQDITPTPAPTTTIVIARAVPVITKVTTNTNTSGGTFTVSVTGYSTPRDMSTATFHFTAASGTTLAQPDVSVNVGSAFTTWYSSSASSAFGSQFTMTVQFSFSGPINLNTLGVQLTNSVGISANAGL